MKQPEPHTGEARMHATHRKRIEAMRVELEGIIGNARLITHRISEMLEQGGQLNAQPQVTYLTGAYARLLKDWGVVEQLQTHQLVKQAPPLNGRR